MNRRIRKAVFPVAGLGTRFLPATKTVPKEMLPIIDKPLIQYAVDEAVEAGCDTLIFVTNRYKHAVADYFDKAYELEQKLERAGKLEQLELVRNVLPSHVRAVFVTQAETPDEIATAKALFDPVPAANKRQFVTVKGGVHGSSTLILARNSGAEDVWSAVLAFLDTAVPR